MAVTIKELLNGLGKWSPEVITSRREELCGYRLLHSGEKPDKPDCLCLGYVSQLKDWRPFRGCALLLVEDCALPDELKSEADSSLLLLPEGTELEQVFDAVQDCFNDAVYVADCTARLLQVCRQNRGLQALLDLGYEMLGNPLLLVDISLCFVAHAGGNTVEDEPLWEWTLSKGYVTEEYVNSVMIEEGDRQVAESDAFIWEKGLLNHTQLVGRVMRGNVPLAYLKLLAYNKPLTDRDQKVLGVLCGFLALQMPDQNSGHPAEFPLVETFLTALLNQKLYDNDAIEERVRRFNLKFYDHLHIIVVELGESLKAYSDRLFHFKRKLQNFLNRDTVVIYVNYLVAVYDTKEQVMFTPQEEENFCSLLSTYGARAGVSLPFRKLYEVPEQYKRAVTTLNIAHQLKKQERLHYYNDCILEHMLLIFSERADMMSLVHPAVHILKENDEKKKGSLWETLTAYLNNNQDIIQTSKQLHIHYNTLKYRLKRIVEQTGLDLLDSRTVFRLQLSGKVLDIRERMMMEES